MSKPYDAPLIERIFARLYIYLASATSTFDSRKGCFLDVVVRERQFSPLTSKSHHTKVFRSTSWSILHQ